MKTFEDLHEKDLVIYNSTITGPGLAGVREILRVGENLRITLDLDFGKNIIITAPLGEYTTVKDGCYMVCTEIKDFLRTLWRDLFVRQSGGKNVDSEYFVLRGIEEQLLVNGKGKDIW